MLVIFKVQLLFPLVVCAPPLLRRLHELLGDGGSIRMACPERES